MDIESLPPLRDVIANHELRAEKKLGQNFLLDQNITDKIARAAGDLSDAVVFEIGPGPGGLTRSLLKAGAKNLTAIEFDPRAIQALESLKSASEGRLEIMQQDALKTDLMALGDAKNRIIVANLPYNIATPLLIGWLKQIRNHHHAYRSMTLMFQREVAERIVAKTNTKSYGRLAVISQWLCDVKICFDLPPQAFTPPPKVKSSVVHFTPKTLGTNAPRFETVEAITAAAFQQRRKMVRSSLAAYREQLESAGIDEQLRAENIEIKDFITLAQLIS